MAMDINDIRAVMTVASFLVFIGIVVWAYSGGRKQRFDRAARSVLEEEDAADRERGRGETR
jgi:cytochrome c oxidase cbb3-type subunit IV